MQIACPVCHGTLEHKLTRKNKPYFVCEQCGVQVFVRFQSGIDLLKSSKADSGFPLNRYVVCRSCQIAVPRSTKKLTKPLLAKSGIYCPECGKLLLKSEELASGTNQPRAAPLISRLPEDTAGAAHIKWFNPAG